MPFDTTYHIPAEDNNSSVKFIVPGGKDTDIYISKGSIPPGLDSFSAIVRDLKKATRLTTTTFTRQNNQPDYTPVIFIAIVAMVVFIKIRLTPAANNSNRDDDTTTPKDNTPSYLTYYGGELNFKDEEIIPVLNKRFPYYSALPSARQQKFIERIQLFIADKIFKIHDTIGYKEMPILISAAAIQLTFGLEKYLLPNFKFIHVYPEEFLGMYPSIRVLEGNVSGHTINLSWKHFLKGYEDINDGQNVGLHELSHALYYQNFVVEENVDCNFRDTFDEFNNYGNKVFQQESLPGNDLYSDYALKNFQEFWAESIEIFFEKPQQLKNCYPVLYTALTEMLNQDPSAITL